MFRYVMYTTGSSNIHENYATSLVSRIILLWTLLTVINQNLYQKVLNKNHFPNVNQFKIDVIKIWVHLILLKSQVLFVIIFWSYFKFVPIKQLRP